MALWPALGQYSTLYWEAGPCGELSVARAWRSSFVCWPPPWTLRALAPGCRSFWDTSADPRPQRLYPFVCGWAHRLEGASPPWWWLQGRKRASAPPSLPCLHPWGSRVEAASPESPCPLEGQRVGLPRLRWLVCNPTPTPRSILSLLTTVVSC